MRILREDSLDTHGTATLLFVFGLCLRLNLADDPTGHPIATRSRTTYHSRTDRAHARRLHEAFFVRSRPIRSARYSFISD